MLSRRLFLRRAAVAPLIVPSAVTALASLATPPVAAAAPVVTLSIKKTLSSWEQATWTAIHFEINRCKNTRTMIAARNFKPYRHTYKELTP